ncbi:MAG TPA: hypothetical protein VJC08_01705, partial [bacterium]|nr:hypothetical protein [bacterium]
MADRSEAKAPSPSGRTFSSTEHLAYRFLKSAAVAKLAVPIPINFHVSEIGAALTSLIFRLLELLA